MNEEQELNWYVRNSVLDFLRSRGVTEADMATIEPRVWELVSKARKAEIALQRDW